MTEIVIYNAKKNRNYVRKFDHDEARRRHAAGEAVADLAREYGVTWAAVARVVDPRVEAAMRANTQKAYAATCERCGKPCLSHRHAAKRNATRDLCLRCSADLKTERFRYDDLGQLAAVRCCNSDCANGQRWQPPENFSRGDRHSNIRDGGIHTFCRACNTRARREYRERHKVPCASCGTPILNPSEDKRGRHTGLCRSCWRESPEGHAAIAKAAATRRTPW